MADYSLTPEKNHTPAATLLLEEIHRYGFPVEIHLDGPADNWTSILFHEPGPPRAECLLARNPSDGRFTLSLPPGSPGAAQEIQLFLLDILLRETGGHAENTLTRERLDARGSAEKIRSLHSPDRSIIDWFWMVFPWATAVFGAGAAFAGPVSLRVAFLVLALLALLSAAGLTFFPKSE